MKNKLLPPIKRFLLPLRNEDIGYTSVLPGKAVLSYDDGPTRTTSDLLDTLAVKGVKAIFFVLAEKAAKKPELIWRMHSEGHEIGLHGYDHTDFGSVSPSRAFSELEKALKVLVAEIGIPRNAVFSFRPPWGFPWRLRTFYKIPAFLKILDELDLRITLWSYDPKDWEIHEGTTSSADVIKKIEEEFNGGIVLLHDIYPAVVSVTDSVIRTANKNGISIIKSSEWRCAVSDRRGEN